MRLVAVIEDERIARRILAHMGLSTRAPLWIRGGF
jgi:hypothetical protein